MIATVAAPTIIKGQEKPAEGETAEGAEERLQLKELSQLQRLVAKRVTLPKMKKEKKPLLIKNLQKKTCRKKTW